MPGSVFTTILASASSAPVLPAETTPAASPAATASIAIRIEAPRMRSAAVGLRSSPIASGAWRKVQTAAARLVAGEQRCQPRLVADQQEARRGMAFGGDRKAGDDHVRRAVAAHAVDGQRKDFAHVRPALPPRCRLRRGRHPSGACPPPRPRARHNGRNGCRHGAGASVRRNWGIRRGPRGAAPGGRAACRVGTARFFSSGRP